MIIYSDNQHARLLFPSIRSSNDQSLHGLTATHQDRVNGDLLAFIKGAEKATA